MLTVEKKINHLRELGIRGNMTEIEKMYRGQNFNTKDETYQKVLKLSKEYCLKFTNLSGLISTAKDPTKIERYKKEKNEILDKLFPGHGQIFGGGDGLFAIIGLVDLDGYNYINARVHFNPYSLVHLKEYVFVASNVEFGPKEPKNSKDMQLGKIIVGEDTWIGANVTFDNGTLVGERSVIGMGSHIVTDSRLESNSICVGDPCKKIKEIPENYETTVKKPGKEGIRTDDEIKQIIEHLKKLGINGNFEEYIKALKYEKYNTLEPTIAQIYALSHKLCSEYNSGKISIRRRKEILDALFPLHGDNLVVGDDIFVDCIGTVKIGNDVTIGNSSTLAGNITIGDGVIIGNNVTLQTTGHEIYYEGRKLNNKNGVLCVTSTPGFIIISPYIVLADGTKVIPDKYVRRNTKEGELITSSR